MRDTRELCVVSSNVIEFNFNWTCPLGFAALWDCLGFNVLIKRDLLKPRVGSFIRQVTYCLCKFNRLSTKAQKICLLKVQIIQHFIIAHIQQV